MFIFLTTRRFQLGHTTIILLNEVTLSEMNYYHTNPNQIKHWMAMKKKILDMARSFSFQGLWNFVVAWTELLLCQWPAT